MLVWIACEENPAHPHVEFSREKSLSCSSVESPALSVRVREEYAHICAAVAHPPPPPPVCAASPIVPATL